MSDSFAQLVENQEFSIPDYKIGSIIDCTVLRVEKDFITVDSGLKSETYIPVSEFISKKNGNTDVNIGDIVKVILEQYEDGFGVTTLSREKAQEQEIWMKLDEAHREQSNIEGDILERVKGGFSVMIGALRAFLPGSLVDSRPIQDPESLEHTTSLFKIVKMDRERNNIVVSRKAVLEEENSAEREALLETLKEGAIYKGIVKNLTDYGAFVDLGGIDGLLHITDMSWRRIRNPSEMVAIGDEIEVIVLKYVAEEQRVSLGLRQLQPNPWENIEERFMIGNKYTATVTNLTDYGCFAEIEDGIEGLVHVSEMDWTNKNIHPSKVVTVGDEIEVMMLNVDKMSRRISLGMKQCTANPWEEFINKYQANDTIKGPIKSITDFGLFIGLEGNIDGLVHLSDIDWALPGEEAIKQYSRGMEIEALILNIDGERERISLGIKQLRNDPFITFTTVNSKGSIVIGKVTAVDERLVTLELEQHVIGTVKVGELSRDKVTDATTAVEIGQTIEAKILLIDRKTRSISLSVRAKDIQQDKQAMRDLNKQSPKVATIGDLIKEQIVDK